MIDAKFFEQYPLYRKFSYPGASAKDPLSVVRGVPSVQAECSNCACGRTFAFLGSHPTGDWAVSRIWYDDTLLLEFACGGCQKFKLRYLVKCFDGSLQKVGQDPAWSIQPPAALQKALGEHLDLYKKALMSESVGYGIGAYAYYRRIVEEVIDGLMESVEDVIREDEAEQYRVALEKAKKETVAAKKIQLVKHLLPPALMVDGINPLDCLHSGLSEGLHARTDEECLQLADAMRTALTCLLEGIQREKEQKGQFSESMRKVLDKHWPEDT